ncbi:MAG: DUF917 domain-containing protein [Anaerolineae bacterium]|nr:DUF917 domain-containing protein [Anaerolineae bacterium]MCA9888229.1 DUF917 domain-containing protein [Anaerolineae bacterium]MCA9893480.1 DUF917 domain-containing protein [Anaerolineae bacterium]MCB9461061.1 DUF917 domain-containing protein [Anaerolineaceae bacterium]
MRIIDENTLEDLALGAAVLGTGGGGDPYIGKLMARQAIRDYGPVEMYTLDELADDDLIVPTAMMGAPTVMLEKMPNGDDIINAFESVGKYIGKPIKATMSIEAGGLNSVVPIYVAARKRIPLVDCDGMGRAFPEIQMVTHTLFGISATPMAMSDERGNTVLMETINNNWTETFARSITVNMGAMAMIALYAATVGQLKQAAIPGTMSYAMDIGKVIQKARVQEDDPVNTVREAVGGYLVFKGKIGDVQRRTEGGFAKGDAFIDGIDAYSGQKLQLSFQNEHLAVRIDGEYRVTVPDLIALLDVDTGEPITTESMRYGFRVAVIAFPSNEKWRTPEGIALVGPRYFGYDVDFVPVEERFG